MITEYGSTTDQLFATAVTAIDRATMFAGRIGGQGQPSLLEGQFSHHIKPPSLEAPPQFSDLFSGADKGDALISVLNDKVDAWVSEYFPAINGGFKNINEDWCTGVISSTKPFGVESTVFELVWHQARDRAYRTTRSEQRTLEAAFASQGFSLPPGALVDAITQSEQRATDAILNVSRDQAIKDAEIKVEILKHAVSIASQLKTSILNISAEFFRSYYSVYAMDNDAARIRAQAYQSYYSALSDYHGVEVAWERMRMASAEKTADTSNAIDRNRVALYGDNGAAAAHAQASRGMAEIAASSANAAGTLVAHVETSSA
jgi:hypothetical protein